MSSELKDLLKLLEDNKHIPGNDVELFIKEHSLQTSKKCTHTYIIYWIYLKWKAQLGNGTPVPRNMFFKLFKKYFKPASRDRVRRYYVTSKHFILHPDEIGEARKECKAERIWHARRRAELASRPVKNLSEPWRHGMAVIKRNRLKRRRGI